MNGCNVEDDVGFGQIYSTINFIGRQKWLNKTGLKTDVLLMWMDHIQCSIVLHVVRRANGNELFM